jgi:hypothetical protein
MGELRNEGRQVNHQVLVLHCALQVFDATHIAPNHLHIGGMFQCKPSIGPAGQIKAAYAVTSAGHCLEGADTDIAKSACN